MFRSCLTLCLTACLSLLPVATVRSTGTEAAGPPFITATAFEHWLAHNPSPLDALPPHARELFLDALDFGPRGARGFPYGELRRDLTTAEIGEVQRLLFGETATIGGLAPAEAKRLRDARANGVLMPPTAHVLDGYRVWRRGQRSNDPQADTAMDRLIAQHASRPHLQGEDLRLLYRAAVERADVRVDGAGIEHALALHARLQATGLATAGDPRDIQQMLLAAGRVDAARAFTTRMAEFDLPPVPRLAHARALPEDARRIWRVEDDDRPEPTLREEALTPRTRIIVVSSIGCGFSNAAAAAIPDDPELGPVFAEHAVWLTSPRAMTHVAALRDWNRRHPATPIHIAVDASQWPMPLDTFPQFLVFRNGELRDRHSGWPRDGSDRDALHTMLVRAGFLRSTGETLAAGDNLESDPMDR